VSRFRLAGRHLVAAFLLLFGTGVSHDLAHAQGKLDARYTASLAGVPIGRGAWVVDIADDQYTAAASGTTSGLLRVFSTGFGTSASRGLITAGQLVPGSYASSITSDKKTDEVRMALVAGNVKEYVVEPPPTPNPERVPLTDAHRRGVTDPMTASLVHVPGNGDLIHSDACQHATSIFDGRMRYDLTFAFKRIETVKADKGYQGPAVVCAAYFAPVAGHIPDRAAIKYLANLKEMEIWLVPIAGTRILVPFRVSIPTPIGLGVLQATQFVSLAQPARPTTSAKTQ
jgi:Protein of unknown function (DUF3108)